MKNQNALPKKVYVIREDGVDAFYYVFYQKNTKGSDYIYEYNQNMIYTEAIFSKDENTAIYSRKHGMKRNLLVQ